MTMWNGCLPMRSAPCRPEPGSAGKSVKWRRGSRERARTDVFRHLAASHLGLPVQQAAWHADVRDRRLAERAPRLAAAAVRTVKDVARRPDRSR